MKKVQLRQPIATKKPRDTSLSQYATSTSFPSALFTPRQKVEHRQQQHRCCKHLTNEPNSAQLLPSLYVPLCSAAISIPRALDCDVNRRDPKDGSELETFRDGPLSNGFFDTTSHLGFLLQPRHQKRYKHQQTNLGYCCRSTEK